ncbi:MAG: dihydroorotate dehydrogenase, partial [Reinekea sp.]
HEAEEKLRVGADLVQLYTGFIYHGPALVRQAIERVARL